MSLAVEFPSDVAAAPSSPSGYGSHSGSSNSESSLQHPGTPQSLFQSVGGGHSNQPLNILQPSGSSFLSRSSSVKSTKSDNSGKKDAAADGHDGAPKDTAHTGRTVQTATALFGTNATSPVQEHPSSTSHHAFRQFVSTSPRAATEQNQPPERSTFGVTSPGISSSTSTLSVDEMDEDLNSTRSPSPFEDMKNSQLTTSTDASGPPEDLPEGLRLMRVAQKRGVKVIDFAFEGLKREGVVEDWAWEGGAACKGFGIGIGGGAYNGPLKKYRPPPVDPPPEREEDKMVIDSPHPLPSIFSPNANRPRPVSMFADTDGRVIDRPLNSPPAQPRSAIGQPGTLSQSGFLQYLQDRNNRNSMGFPESSNFKRERSFASADAQENDSNPFKKRFIG